MESCSSHCTGLSISEGCPDTGVGPRKLCSGSDVVRKQLRRWERQADGGTVTDRDVAVILISQESCVTSALARLL